MSLTLASITFDCENAADTAAFWSAALDRPVDPGASDHFASIGTQDDAASSNAWLFLQVPEPRTAKNRVHVDFVSEDREGEVSRLLGLGATRMHDKEGTGFGWTTLQDPFGNEFCVADPH